MLFLKRFTVCSYNEWDSQSLAVLIVSSMLEYVGEHSIAKNRARSFRCSMKTYKTGDLGVVPCHNTTDAIIDNRWILA